MKLYEHLTYPSYPMVYIVFIIWFPSISFPAGDEEMQPYAAHKAHMTLGCETELSSRIQWFTRELIGQYRFVPI